MKCWWPGSLEVAEERKLFFVYSGTMILRCQPQLAGMPTDVYSAKLKFSKDCSNH